MVHHIAFELDGRVLIKVDLRVEARYGKFDSTFLLWFVIVFVVDGMVRLGFLICLLRV